MCAPVGVDLLTFCPLAAANGKLGREKKKKKILCMPTNGLFIFEMERVVPAVDDSP